MGKKNNYCGFKKEFIQISLNSAWVIPSFDYWSNLIVHYIFENKIIATSHKAFLSLSLLFI